MTMTENQNDTYSNDTERYIYRRQKRTQVETAHIIKDEIEGGRLKTRCGREISKDTAFMGETQRNNLPTNICRTCKQSLHADTE